MNKKRMFSGWKDIYMFTIKQAVSGKGFKIATIIIALIAFFSLSAINVIVALVNDDEKVELEMKEVIVSDSTGVINDGLENFMQMYPDELSDIEVKISDKNVDEIAEELLEKETTMLIKVYTDDVENEEIYKIEGMIPENSEISDDSAEEFLSIFETYFANMKLMNSGIEADKLITILVPVNISVSVAGEEADTLGEELIKIGLPMIFTLVLYMMLLMYGQSIGKCVISEKTSKLMETMLTTVRPYAIITGKVLGMASVAVGQIVLWVFMGITGFIIGDKIASHLVDGYTNVVIEVVELVRKDLSDAFSVEAMIVSVLIVCIGFVMYCIFAALLSSAAKRAEELNNSNAMYTLVVVAGFLMSYMLPIDNTNNLAKYINYIPPLAVYKLPTDVLLGKITLVETAICMALMLITIFVLIVITGKIYKKKVF